jgi:hypothetical protein
MICKEMRDLYMFCPFMEKIIFVGDMGERRHNILPVALIIYLGNNNLTVALIILNLTHALH